MLGPDAPLARLIREAREAQNLSQAGAGAKLGVSQTLVSLWETGKRLPPLERFGDIADVLGIPLADLIAADPHHAELFAQLTPRLAQPA